VKISGRYTLQDPTEIFRDLYRRGSGKLRQIPVPVDSPAQPFSTVSSLITGSQSFPPDNSTALKHIFTRHGGIPSRDRYTTYECSMTHLEVIILSLASLTSSASARLDPALRPRTGSHRLPR